MNSFEDIVESLSGVDETEASRLGKLASILSKLADRKQQLESELDTVNGDMRRIQEQDIPALMAELGMKKFTLEDGSEVKVAPFYSASISKERQDEAFGWLNENGFGDLIKNTVTAKFGKGQDDQAMSLLRNLVANGFNAETAKKVEPQTLKAWVKEQFEQGNNVPTDLFGVYVGQKATIKKG